MVTWLRHGGCKVIAFFSYKSNLCVHSLVPQQTKERKETKRGKARTTKAKFPTKIRPYKVLLIYDD